MIKTLITLAFCLFLSGVVVAQNTNLSRTANLQQHQEIQNKIAPSLKSSPIWEQDFEDYDDFTLDFSPWTTIDVDEGATYGINGVMFLNMGAAMSFIVFNPDSTSPPLTTDESIQPHSGDRFAACFSSIPPNTNDDWLITPQLILGNNSFISFWVKSYTSDYGLETYNVAVSTTGNEVDDFTVIYGPYHAPAIAWQQKTLDISNYNNDTVYLAIQCTSEDHFIFMVDDIIVDTQAGISEISNENVKVYPNPASEQLFIDTKLNIDKFELLDLRGKIIFSGNSEPDQTTIDVSFVNPGMYLLRIYIAGQFKAYKISIK